MAIDWNKLEARLRHEASEYLADLRNFGEALKRTEGWVTLGLILAVIFMVVVWFITGLGFDRLNTVISALGQSHGRICRPLTDFSALVVVIDAVVMGMLAIVTLGEMMQLLNRVNKGLPKRPGQVAIPAAMMLVVGIGGIIYMRAIC